MAPRLPLARFAQLSGQTCAACAKPQIALSISETHRARGVSQTWLAKVADGENRWREKAIQIEEGKADHAWDVLVERGFVKDVAGTPEKIREVMRVKRIGAYVGIDPTADSMHLGHLLPFMALFWLWMHGHPAITLLGGATARIGDPTDRLESRQILSNAEISKNVTKLHFQLARLWTNVVRLREKYGFENDWAAKRALLNNNMWLGKLTLYDFNKRLARHMRMGPLLSRDT